jgi:hypothetical protein
VPHLKYTILVAFTQDGRAWPDSLASLSAHACDPPSTCRARENPGLGRSIRRSPGAIHRTRSTNSNLQSLPTHAGPRECSRHRRDGERAERRGRRRGAWRWSPSSSEWAGSLRALRALGLPTRRLELRGITMLARATRRRSGALKPLGPTSPASCTASALRNLRTWSPARNIKGDVDGLRADLVAGSAAWATADAAKQPVTPVGVAEHRRRRAPGWRAKRDARHRPRWSEARPYCGRRRSRELSRERSTS